MSKVTARNSVIAALDVGTTKVCCFIAITDEQGQLQISGVGHHRANGMRNGEVVNMDALEASVRAAVDAAEQMAKQRIDSVFVNLTCGSPRSSQVEVELAVSGHEIRDADVRRIMEHAGGHFDAGDRDLIHCIPTSYSIDGSNGIIDPRGMYGERLGVNIHLVTAALGQSRNFSTVIEHCHLDIEDKVVSAYASGLACLVEDEKELGVTVIDMGGGTTSVAVFQKGHIEFVGSVPIGGNHVTSDIAKGLSTPIAKAERLKTVYGSVVQTPSDERELIKVPLVGEDDENSANEVPKSMLVQIIQPRLEETFEFVRDMLEVSGYSQIAGRRVVITGGASQLEGIRDLAELVLDKQVRLGRPKTIKGLPESVSGPAFATTAGLLRYAINEHVILPDIAETVSKGRGVDRIGQWLKENF